MQVQSEAKRAESGAEARAVQEMCRFMCRDRSYILSPVQNVYIMKS